MQFANTFKFELKQMGQKPGYLQVNGIEQREDDHRCSFMHPLYIFILIYFAQELDQLLS